MKETVIQIPVQCVNCGYPKQYGATVNAEIKCPKGEEIVRKVWRCPVCNCEKTIEISMPKFEEAKPSRFLIQSQPKKQAELPPGVVGTMSDT